MPDLRVRPHQRDETGVFEPVTAIILITSQPKRFFLHTETLYQ